MISTRKIAVGLLAFCFFLTPLAVWTPHFLPFETMKAFLFSVLVLLAALAAAVDATLHDRWTILQDRLTLAVAAYLVYNVVSFVLHPYTDPHAIFLLLCCGALFFTLRLCCDRQARDLILWVLFAVGLLSALYALLQFAGIDYRPFVDYFWARKTIGIRSFSFFGNPNLLGSFCVFLIPLLAAFMLKAWREKKFSLLAAMGIILLLTITAMVMSQTRSAWMAAGVTSLAALFVASAAAKRARVKWIEQKPLIWGGAVILLAVMVAAGFGILSWTSSHDTSIEARIASKGITFRQFYYRNTLAMISESPRTVLLGHGIGTFNVYYPVFRDSREAFRLGESNPEFRVEHAHNEHLEIISDIGLIGYFLFLWIIGEALWRLLRQSDWISLATGISIVGLLIDGLMTQSLRYIVIGSLLWLMIGFSGIVIEGAVVTGDGMRSSSRKRY